MALKVTKTTRTEVKKLREEVAALRSFVIGVAGRDPEGNYRPEFVRQILTDSPSKPIASFESPQQFLDLLAKIED